MEEQKPDHEGYMIKIIDSIADPIFVKDREHRWILLNNAYCNLMGLKKEDLLGKTDFDFFPKEEAAIFWEKDEIVFQTAKENINEERFTDTKGSAHTIVTKKTLFTDKKGNQYIVGIIRDMSENKNNEKSLQHAYKLFRHIFDIAPIGIFIVNNIGKVEYVNSAMLQISADTREEFESISAFTLNSHKSIGLDENIRSALLNERSFSLGPVQYTSYFGQKTTTCNFIGMPLKDGDSTKVLIFVEDITQLKKIEEEARALSLTDPLTGLYNRRGFLTLGLQQAKLAKRNKESLVLLFADVNNMKWINDTFGHPEGDAALTELAILIRSTFRDSDIIARIGGDEFVVLAIKASEIEGKLMINRLKANLARRNAEAKQNYPLSLSIGLACSDGENPCSIDELLSKADQLMYEQKRASQNQ